MSFTLKRKADFEFALEDEPEKIYTIPTASKLGFEDAQAMAKFADENNLVKQGRLVKDFILKFAPDLKNKDIGDMEYYEILKAYFEFAQVDNLGELQASQSL